MRFASADPRGSLPRAPAVGGQSLSRRSSVLAPGFPVLTDFSHPPRTTTRQRPRFYAARRSVAWAFALRGAPPPPNQAPRAHTAPRRRVLGRVGRPAIAGRSSLPRTRQRSARSRPPLHPGPWGVQQWPRLRCCGSSVFRGHCIPPAPASAPLALARGQPASAGPCGAMRGRSGSRPGCLFRLARSPSPPRGPPPRVAAAGGGVPRPAAFPRPWPLSPPAPPPPLGGRVRVPPLRSAVAHYARSPLAARGLGSWAGYGQAMGHKDK